MPPTVSTIAATATLVLNAKKIKEEVIIPLINSINRDQKSKAVIASALESYVRRNGSKYKSIFTIVYPGKKMDLLQLYVPLILKKSGSDEKFYKIDNFDVRIFRDKMPKLVVDNAGMGKSILSKYLFLSTLKEYSKVPILIELRRLDGLTIIDFIRTELTNSKYKPTLIDIEMLLSSGQLVLLFDGLDEVSKVEAKAVLRQIDKLIEEDTPNDIILTSRDSDALTNLPNYDKYYIKPLDFEDAKLLIVKYGLGNQGMVEDLLKAVKKTRNEINEFLKNPLMVSLLFKAFEYKHYIPIRKNIFYKQVFDALFESHDLSKGEGYRREKECKLDIDEFHKVCRILGFISYKRGKIEYKREELVIIINECKALVAEFDFKPADLIDDLVRAVPLFVQEGSIYRWMHKSFQEYFAAQALYIDFSDNIERVLTSMFNSTELKHNNFLDLYFDIDEHGFAKYILLPFIEEYKLLIAKKQKILIKSGMYSDRLLEVSNAKSFCVAVHLDKSSETEDPARRYLEARNFLDKRLPESKGYMIRSLGDDLYAFIEMQKNDYIPKILVSKGMKFISSHAEIPDLSLDKQEELKEIINRLGPIGNINDKIKYNLSDTAINSVSTLLSGRGGYLIDVPATEVYLDRIIKSRQVKGSLFDF